MVSLEITELPKADKAGDTDGDNEEADIHEIFEDSFRFGWLFNILGFGWRLGHRSDLIDLIKNR